MLGQSWGHRKCSGSTHRAKLHSCSHCCCGLELRFSSRRSPGAPRNPWHSTQRRSRQGDALVVLLPLKCKPWERQERLQTHSINPARPINDIKTQQVQHSGHSSHSHPAKRALQSFPRARAGCRGLRARAVPWLGTAGGCPWQQDRSGSSIVVAVPRSH